MKKFLTLGQAKKLLEVLMLAVKFIEAVIRLTNNYPFRKASYAT